MKKVYEIPELEVLLLDVKQVAMDIKCVVSGDPNEASLFPDAPNFGDFEKEITPWTR